jgi:preprotein translocase subunit SecA
MGFFNFGGDIREKTRKKYTPFVELVNKHEPELASKTADELKAIVADLKTTVSEKGFDEHIESMAFALIREASKRTIGQRHYDEQIIGGKIIHEGNIAEMRTGEGKTLVATLPAFLNSLSGKGVHIITVNDFLARRDAGWMGQVFNYLGVSVSVIGGQTSFIYDPSVAAPEDTNDEEVFRVVYEKLRPCTRPEAYQADITYGTNSEFGFDYLRDNLIYDVSQKNQRGHNYAIIDEIDSILIDEARTPLIISQPAEDSDELYAKFAGIARSLHESEDYSIDEKLKAIQLTDSGISKTENEMGVENIYTEKGIRYVHHLENAVRAKALYLKDRDYVVKNGEVIIVDPFTGRMQPGRRWSDGLHQAIEAKEGVKVEQETRTVGSITYQNYFRFYDKLSGMTGTAMTSREEFYKVYKIDVIPVPTHRAIKRVDHNDQIFQTEKGKFAAVAKKVKELQKNGQPVLIGTVSIEKSELLSAYLNSEGVKHTILNAKNHEKEGEIIAQAGRRGSVMVATNMAGRGIDIILGGMPVNTEDQEAIKAMGGLYVIGTERHEARRIDNQLRGRAGRQGDPGETVFYVSLEDDLMRIFGSERIKTMMGRFGIPEDQPIENGMITKTLENAQAKIEGFHFDARKHTLEYDDVLSTQRNSIYARRAKLVESDKAELDIVIDQISKTFTDVDAIFDEKIKELGEEAFYNTFKQICLYTNDLLWIDHLETMEYMRNSVNLRAYGQREPLVEYKKEGLERFKAMEVNFLAECLNLVKTMQAQKN